MWDQYYRYMREALSFGAQFFFLLQIQCFEADSVTKNHFSLLLFSKTNTFECICSPWGKVLVRVELEGQLPVCLLQIIITSIFGNTKNLIKVLAILYPAETKDNRCQNTSQNFKKEKRDSVRSQFNIISILFKQI